MHALKYIQICTNLLDTHVRTRASAPTRTHMYILAYNYANMHVIHNVQWLIYVGWAK